MGGLKMLIQEDSFSDIIDDLTIYEGINVDYKYYKKLGVRVIDGWIIELDGERYELPLSETEAEYLASDIIWNKELHINKQSLITALKYHNDSKLQRL